MNAKGFEKATQTAKLTLLNGRWSRVDAHGFMTGAFVALKAQNGFWAQHKVSKGTVFVVTTGPNKGLWTEVTY